MPKKVVITLNSEYGDPVETDLNGGGETMTVENPFIVTTAEGETLSGIVYDHFIKYRNTADVLIVGNLRLTSSTPSHSVLSSEVTWKPLSWVQIEFDGTLSGSLSVRYQLGGKHTRKGANQG